MKPGSKTRTRQTLSGGTKTVTKSKNSTGANTRTVTKTSGSYHKDGFDVQRNIRRADKSGVSKLKSRSITRTNIPFGAGTDLNQSRTEQSKNTFRKRGSLVSKKRDLETSTNRVHKSVSNVSVKGGKFQGGGVKDDLPESLKKSPNNPRMTYKSDEEKTKVTKHKRVDIEASNKRLYRKFSKDNAKKTKNTSVSETFDQKKHRMAAATTTLGRRVTNKEVVDLNRNKNVDLSKQYETGKTYTPKQPKNISKNKK